MRLNPENPEKHALPPGITEDQLLEVVRESGYPLQSVVARQLVEQQFEVVEEWGYRDRVTGEPRSCDVFAVREIASSLSLDVSVALLIECKRADLPFVFFAPAVPRPPYGFPAVCGFPDRHFELHRPGMGSRQVTAATFLSLQDYPFISAAPAVATAFARCERKGKSLELSGSMPFNGILLPLLSVQEHCAAVWAPTTDQRKLLPLFAVPLAVIDGTILLARGTPEEPDLSLEPWVRVLRDEPIKDDSGWDRRRFAVDVVHRHFLPSYLARHLLPFAEAIAGRILEKESIVAAGKAVVPSWLDCGWTYLQPVPVRT